MSRRSRKTSETARGERAHKVVVELARLFGVRVHEAVQVQFRQRRAEACRAYGSTTQHYPLRVPHTAPSSVQGRLSFPCGPSSTAARSGLICSAVRSGYRSQCLPRARPQDRTRQALASASASAPWLCCDRQRMAFRWYTIVPHRRSPSEPSCLEAAGTCSATCRTFAHESSRARTLW